MSFAYSLLIGGGSAYGLHQEFGVRASDAARKNEFVGRVVLRGLPGAGGLMDTGNRVCAT
jgi:hypothetical protein